MTGIKDILYLCTMKICCRCKIPKDDDEFHKWHKAKDGLTSQCKLCRAKMFKKYCDSNPEKVKQTRIRTRQVRREYYEDPERKLKYRKKYIENSFNISYSLYEELQEKQSNLCAICGNPEISTRNSYLCIDHNHSTGEVRGLLCNKCNRGLGLFEDNQELLIKAITYLKNNKL